MLTISLSAQNDEANNNQRISTSWQYNVHLYKGMFDFKPPVMDTSSYYYPWHYMSYVNFRYSSDILFSVEYRITNSLYVCSGVNLFVNTYTTKANIDLINSLTNVDVGYYSLKRFMLENILYLPFGIKYKYKRFALTAGINCPMVNFSYTKKIFSNNVIEKDFYYNKWGCSNGNYFTPNLFLAASVEELFNLKNFNVGLTFKCHTYTSFRPFPYFGIGVILNQNNH